MKPARVPHINIGTFGHDTRMSVVAAAVREQGTATAAANPMPPVTLATMKSAQDEIRSQYPDLFREPQPIPLLVIDDPVLPDGQSNEAALLERWLEQNPALLAEIIKDAFSSTCVFDLSDRLLGLALPPHNRSPKPLRRLKHALECIAYQNRF